MAEPATGGHPSPAASAATASAATLSAAAAPVSLTALSPLQQGDAVSGLILAIAGIGPGGIGDLPNHLTGGLDRDGIDASDAWVSATGSDTGWYVLLTQDCDIVREPRDEPTVLIAPLTLVDAGRWQDLRRNGYSSRWYAYPGSKFHHLPTGKALAVDLSWTTSVLKGALAAPAVTAVRPFTGPEQRSFSEWLSMRTGRPAFPDAVVTNVLDPCYEARRRLSRTFDRAPGPTAAKVEARVVAAVDQWFAHHDGRLVHLLGALTGPRLQAAGLIDASTGQPLTEDLKRGTERLQTAMVTSMNKANANSGYQIAVNCVDLARIPASQFLQFSLLLR